jgi:hypothetical protein
MLTNTWLGIIQQVLVERWVQSKVAAPARIEVREVDEDTASKPAMKGKGKRARG